MPLPTRHHGHEKPPRPGRPWLGSRGRVASCPSAVARRATAATAGAVLAAGLASVAAGAVSPPDPGTGGIAHVLPPAPVTTEAPATTAAPVATTVPAAEAAEPEPPRPTPSRAARSAPRSSIPEGDVASDDLLDRLADCESHRNPTAVSRSGRYRGAFQFLLSTWRGLGMDGDPIDFSYEVQRDVARRIPVSTWPRQFPACSRRLQAS